jgi:uncharacterized protein (TIGR04255 family)
MDFPSTDRVIYEKNPLREVVCQLRFPRILVLEERVPAEFQQQIAEVFPFVESRDLLPMQVGYGGDFQTQPRPHYDFISMDRQDRITLCSEFVAFSTTNYERWEKFSVGIHKASDALLRSYSVPTFTRIGLRYVDVISRLALGLTQTKWSELIRPSALGLLAEKDVPIDSVADLSAATIIRLDVGKVLCRTGFFRTEQTGDETTFVIDSDFFEDSLVEGNSNDFTPILNGFNRIAGNAFRWFIQQRLHEALGPRSPR